MEKQLLFEGSEEDLNFLLEISKNNGIKLSIPKTYTKEEKQLLHKNAYEPWTEKDDEKLEILYCVGKKVAELSEVFGRNEGAIRSRIKKLELFEKYGKIK